MLLENQIILGDCLEELRKLPDNCIDVVITDPPYGLGMDALSYHRRNKRYGNAKAFTTDYGNTNWDTSIPSQEIFDEIRRISKHQIIFGGNFFATSLPPSRCWLTWDKRTDDKYNNNFADCELIYTSFNKPSRMIRFLWNGMIQGDMKNKEKRYHPTQRPQVVMRWIIEKYTHPNDLILDPFAGSGSTLLACKNLGRRYIGIENESRYVEIARARLETL